MQQKLKMQILYNGLPRLWTNYYILIYYTHSQELMKPVGSHGSLSLQFVKSKLMVWLFVYMTVSGQPWQLITIICDEEGDGLTLFCVQDSSHKVKIALHCIVAFKLLLWRFLCIAMMYSGNWKRRSFCKSSLLNCCKIGQMYFKADSRMCKLNLAVYLRLHLALSLAALHIWIRAHSITVSLRSVELRFAENLTEICLQFHNKRTRGEKNTTVFF